MTVTRMKEKPAPAGRPANRLRWDVLLFALLMAAIVAGSGLLLLSLSRDLTSLKASHHADRRLALTAVAVEALWTGEIEPLSHYLQKATRSADVDGIVVFNGDSEIVANSWQGTPLNRNGVVRKLMEGSWDQWAIRAGTRDLGFVEVALGDQRLANNPLVNPVNRLWILGGVAGLGLLLLPVLASRMVHGGLSNRIELMCESIDALAHGKYETRLPTTGTGPLTKLSRSFNRMAVDLERNVDKLRESEQRFELAANGSNEAIWDWDIGSGRIYLSKRFGELLGYSASDTPRFFAGLEGLIHPDDLSIFRSSLERHLKIGRSFNCEFRIKYKSGDWAWILARGRAVKDQSGAFKRMVGSFTDITEQRDAETALMAERTRAEVTLESIVDGVITTDAEARIDYVNKAAERLTGWSGNAARDLPLPEVFRADSATGVPFDATIFSRVLAGGDAEHLGEGTVLKNLRGDTWLVEAVIAPMREPSGQVIGLVVTFHNVTERQQLKDALAREKEQALVTLNSIVDGVITTDARSRIVYLNRAAEEMTGWPLHEAKGRAFARVAYFKGTQGMETKDLVRTLVTAGGSAMDLGVATLTCRDDAELQVERQLVPLRPGPDGVSGAVAVLHNVSEQHKLMEQLSHQARHDALTELVNRYEFELQLGLAIKRAADEHELTYVVCYLDLDQFKIINDSCGHRAGDELLRQVAALLHSYISPGDTFARLGGDEFGILWEHCDLERAKKEAEELRRAVEALKFGWEGQYYSVSASIGLYLVDGNAAQPEGVLSAVDEACFIAKHKGRNQIHVHQPDDAETSRWHSEIEWVPHIHSAMDEDRFLLFAQPIAPIGDKGRPGHYEILLRMRDDRGEIVGPGAFMPAAERYGLMPILDRWVVDSAVEAISRAWQKLGTDSGIDTVGVNISGAVLSDDAFLEHVKWAIKRHAIPPKLLCFEITETLAIANFSLARHFIDELKAMGCQFALDDFGSGFASFNNLRNLPVDYLKIDGSFVRDMMSRKVDYAMVEVINRIGQIMELETIAEFVEDDATLQALKAIGVDYAQGYHIGRPEPLFDVFCSGMLA